MGGTGGSIMGNYPYFDKDTTAILKGIALIMMFIHHFFTFPEWWGAGISYPLLKELSPYFREPFRLCVPVFCFITGYFYFFHQDKSYRYSLKKITDILISYWCVFVPFAVIAAVCVDYQYTLSDFVKECFALHRPTMVFCWYVNFYIAFMLIMPLIQRIMSKNVHVDLIIAFILIPSAIRFADYFVSRSLDNLTQWFPIVLLGYICADHNLFGKIYDSKLIKNKTLNIFVDLIVAFAVPMGRWLKPAVTVGFSKLPLFQISMDMFYTPIFIYVLANLCKAVDFRGLKFILIQIGKYSLLMWFISCIFFNNSRSIFQPILYYPHNPILVAIWGLILCFIPAYVIDIGAKKIQRLISKGIINSAFGFAGPGSGDN